MRPVSLFRRDTMKRVAIVQSAYIPWKGYFDLINLADEVILLDNVQFTRRDWRNRNKIKTANGTLWLTIPVETKGRYRSLINEMEVADADWAAQYWKSIAHWYRRSPGFQTYGSLFEELFLGCEESNLSRINRRFLIAISQLLGSRTRITTATDYDIVSGRSERLWHLCEQVGATHYLSGLSLIRSRGHFLKGGYDVQSGIKQGRPASPAAVL